MESINLRLFWIAMLITATLVVIGIWFEDRLPEAFFKTAGTFFIFGLANFLLWVPQVTYRFLHKI